MIERREFLKGTAAAVAFGIGQNGFAQAAGAALAREVVSGAPVSYDERSVLIGGRRVLISCGEVHYPRSTRAMWPGLLERSKALGLNTIATYVFWNVHETSRGVYDFSGERDLGHFLDLCQQRGLNVFLRVGPYICAEWNYGGYPPYLRDEPGITIRTMNRPYTSRVEAYFERLAEVVRPRLASNGGPVVLVQVENEYANVSKRYGEAGQEYLRWIVQLGKRVGFAGVPQTTCEGGAAGAIETSNGFTISAERIAAVRKSHPGTPLLWTELYPSWYRVWGGRNAQARDPREIAWAILDFVSRGGSGWNYYMWHGGSNFGRNSMYLQTPSYDFHAALDEYGRPSHLGEYLGRFHAVMQEHSSILLQGERKEYFDKSARVTIWRNGDDELRLVQENYPDHMPEGTDLKRSTTLARLLNKEGKILFDLDAVNEQVTRNFINPKWNAVGERLSEWQTWKEPMPAERMDHGVIAVDPLEQLSLTKDSTDYCWYSCKLEVSEAGSQEFVIPYGGDFFYAFVDGSLVTSSKLPLQEDRGAITPEDPAHPRVIANEIERDKVNGFRHAFALPSLAAGEHQLDLLAVAMGMTKGDWQIASPMNFERKGIWEGVLLSGKPLRNWTMRTGLTGEKRILSEKTADVRWDPVGELKTLSWYKTHVHVPEKLLGSSAIFRIDANGLGKGMIWVNGRAIGRHWLINASEPADEPSQRYYHVPADWLRATNDIVILEEQAASPAKVELQVRA